MAYPNFGKVKTIVLPSVWRGLKDTLTLTEEEYFNSTGVKLSDLFHEAGKEHRVLVPSSNVFFLLELRISTDAETYEYTLFAPISIDVSRTDDNDLLFNLYIFKSPDGEEYTRVSIKKDRFGSFSITLEEA